MSKTFIKPFQNPSAEIYYKSINIKLQHRQSDVTSKPLDSQSDFFGTHQKSGAVLMCVMPKGPTQFLVSTLSVYVN